MLGFCVAEETPCVKSARASLRVFALPGEAVLRSGASQGLLRVGLKGSGADPSLKRNCIILNCVGEAFKAFQGCRPLAAADSKDSRRSLPPGLVSARGSNDSSTLRRELPVDFLQLFWLAKAPLISCAAKASLAPEVTSSGGDRGGRARLRIQNPKTEKPPDLPRAAEVCRSSSALCRLWETRCAIGWRQTLRFSLENGEFQRRSRYRLRRSE